ncbi:MAG: hypothetical protein R3F43_05060 [bacterium]
MSTAPADASPADAAAPPPSTPRLRRRSPELDAASSARAQDAAPSPRRPRRTGIGFSTTPATTPPGVGATSRASAVQRRRGQPATHRRRHPRSPYPLQPAVRRRPPLALGPLG